MAESQSPAIKMRCPSCSKKLGFPAVAAGRKARCPSCAQVIQVVAPAPEAAAQQEAPVVHRSDRLQTHCPSCGKSLGLPLNAVGRKARCPACEHVFVVEENPPEPLEVVEEAPPSDEEAPAAGRPSSLFDELADAEGNGEVVHMAGQGAGFQAPASVEDTPRQSKKMDYARAVSGAATGVVGGLVGGAMGAAAPLLKGCLFSFIGILIGAGIWCGVAVVTDYELGFIAWLVGALAGIGMQMGTKSESHLAGFIASGFALLGIFLGRLFIVIYVLWPLFAAMSAANAKMSAANANVSEIEMQREAVAEAMAEESLDSMNKGGKEATEEQEEKAYTDAEKKVTAMSDSEVKKAYEKLANDEAASSTAQGGGSSSTAKGDGSGLGGLFYHMTVGGGMFGFVFLILAVGTAYKLGSGAFSS